MSGLNNLITLYVHKDCTDLLNEIDVANEFVGDSEHRLRLLKLKHCCVADNLVSYIVTK